MSILELLSQYSWSGVGLLIILFSLVEIAPIKINPWTHILRAIGRRINKETIDQIKELKDEIDGVDSRVNDIDSRLNHLDGRIDENNIILCRSRILRFGDEVSHGRNHSRDHFRQILLDITNYNSYCREHPDFKNDMTKITSKRIEDDYVERDKNNNFL